MHERLKTHYRISTRLSMLSDKKLKTLLSKAKLTDGWGQNGIVELDGQQIFIKKVPLTSLEIANALSTKNLYKIPTWYNYGVGSAGFGAFRELAAHVKTTNWVLDGQCAAFPLLYHHRILATEKTSKNISNLKGYIKYWNGSKTIERYMLDRNKSKQHLYLFLEHLTPLSDWMAENPSKMHGMFKKSLKCIDFLRQNGMTHFDAHIYNWLTDGRNVFLTDFGLLLDQEFELTQSEHLFFKSHRDYDYAQVIETFGYALIDNYLTLNSKCTKLIEKEVELSSNSKEPQLITLISIMLALHKKKQITLPSYLTKYIRQYQAIINEKNLFFQDICTGKKSSDKYPARKMRKLLRQLQILE